MIKNKRDNYANRRGQVTIFIIVAILVIGGIVAYLVFRQNISSVSLPTSIQPVYTTFLSCVEEQTQIGIDLLGNQAGYIELPDFEPSSSYMPFSSQLNFLGNPIPYWYYVSGNNIQREQIPSEQDMEKSLADFIDDRISYCNFDNYYDEGFEISLDESKTVVDMKKGNVVVSMNLDLSISKGEDSVVVSNHNLEINSKIFDLYTSAIKVYEKEQKELFLESYGVDTLRLFAPVDGVKITCSPLVWSAEEIFDDLKNAIETNTLALSTENPTNSEEKYFYVDTGVNENVRFINSKDWANSFEVLPSEGVSLISMPVGNQEGLGILGFCYVPYHFVYNLNYPVLVQVYDGDEIFQFPLAIVVQGNQPRKSLDTSASTIENEFCKDKNSFTSVNLFDSDLNPVDAQISYECFGTSCYIGESSSGSLDAEFPQCVNGYIVAKAEGFDEMKYLYSSVEEGNVNIILNKLYELDVDLNVGSLNYNEPAIIYFTSDSGSKIVSYPEQKKVNLSEGDYEISVYVYKNSSINFQETTTEQCMDVAQTGIGGLLGFTEKKCFDITVPAQIVSNVLAGGGKQDYSISNNLIKSSSVVEINANQFSTPRTIEELQNNYLLFEESGLEVNLR